MSAGVIKLFVRREGQTGWGELGHADYFHDASDKRKKDGREDAIARMNDARDGWSTNYPGFAGASFKMEDHGNRYGGGRVVVL